MKRKTLLAYLFVTTVIVFTSNIANSQIRVMPSGNFVMGSNTITSGFKTEIVGGNLVGLGIQTNHTWGFGWAAISTASEPTTKHWVVSANGYVGSHNFYVITTGLAYSNGIVLSSDSRLKQNIRSISNFRSKLDSIGTYYYDFKRGYDGSDYYDTLHNTNKPGFLAQEIQKVFPQLVYKGDDNDRLYVDYIGFIPLLLQYNKELDTEIKDLNKKIEDLKTEIEAIEQGLNNCCNNSSKSNNDSDNTNTSSTPNSPSNNNEIRIVPNPNTGSFEVVSGLFTANHTYDIILTDLTGKLVSNVQKNKETNGTFKISANGIAAGVYYVHLMQNGNIIQTQKAVINI